MISGICSKCAVVPLTTTYPVGGYVNMNQLAHLALHHQGLCPSTDKKQDHEDRDPPGGGRGEQREDSDPRGPRHVPASADGTGLGLLITL